jgi:hypothetical protein
MSATAIVSVVATLKEIDRRFDCAVVDIAASAPNLPAREVLVMRLVVVVVVVLLLVVVKTVEKALVVDDAIDQAKQDTERDGKRMSLLERQSWR